LLLLHRPDTNRYHRMVKRDDGDIAEDVEILKRATTALGRRPKVLRRPGLLLRT